MTIDWKDPTGLDKLTRAIKAIDKTKERGVLISIGDQHWLNEDRDWFRSHPKRSYRLRKAYPGEPAVGDAPWVVVKQIEPGTRSRLTARDDGQRALMEFYEQSEQGARDSWCDVVLTLVWQGLSEQRTQSWALLIAQADFMHECMPATRQ